MTKIHVNVSIVAIMLAVLFSCENESEVEVVPDEAKCQLQGWATPENADQPSSYLFEYNSDNALTKATVTATSFNPMTQETNVTTTTYLFHYSGPTLTNVDLYDGTDTSGDPEAYYEIAVNSENQIIRSTLYTQDADQPVSSDTLTYGSSGALLSIKSGITAYRFEYDGSGNTQKIYSKNPASPEEALSTEYTSFDAKTNPLRSNKVVQWLWVNLNHDSGYSVNNPLGSTTYINMMGTPLTLNFTYTYTYNENGFPTSISQTGSINGQTISAENNLTYACQ